MNSTYPKLTRTVEFIAPGYEGCFTVYQIMDNGSVYHHGFSLSKTSPIPGQEWFGTFEKACEMVDRLIANRVENGFAREVDPIERGY